MTESHVGRMPAVPDPNRAICCWSLYGSAPLSRLGGTCTVRRAVKGVRVTPGATQLTRIPRAAYEAAADKTRPMTPALAAAMASWLARPTRAAAEDTSTIDPPAFIIARAPARTTANALVRYVATMVSHSVRAG